MFFDVTRAGVDRPLRVAVAAIAYLDTLPKGCVLNLVGGQTLQVSESAAEVEERAVAARPIAALQYGDRRVEYGFFPPAPIPLMEPGTEIRAAEPAMPTSAIEADMRQAGVDWTEVLASGLGSDAAPADVSDTAAAPPPAPQATPPSAPKKRRRRGQPS